MIIKFLSYDLNSLWREPVINVGNDSRQEHPTEKGLISNSTGLPLFWKTWKSGFLLRSGIGIGPVWLFIGLNRDRSDSNPIADYPFAHFNLL